MIIFLGGRAAHLGAHVNSLHEKSCAPGHLISSYRRIQDGVTNSLSPLRFSLLVLGFKSLNPLSLWLSFFLSHIYSPVCVVAQSEHYEGLLSPDVIQWKKSRNWFLIFVRCCVSPHLWEHTGSIITHLITGVKMDTEQQQLQPAEAWVSHWNPIEGCTLCICLRFGNN